MNQFTTKYIRCYHIFKVRGARNKGKLQKGGAVEKRFRTTILDLNEESETVLERTVKHSQNEYRMF